MSRADDLQAVEPPPPAEKPVCQACKAWGVECLVPDGDAAIPACWLCAHQMVVHGRYGKQAMRGECDCPIEDIYPKAVLERRRALSEMVARHWSNRSPS